MDQIERKLDLILDAVHDLAQKVVRLETRMDSLESRVGALETGVAGLKKDVGELKLQVGENTAILHALSHSAEVNKAEHDQMSMSLAHLTGEMKGLRRDVDRIEVVTADNYSYIAHIKRAE